jgi:outer membrane immunogenic protein
MRKALGLVGAALLFTGPALAADLGKPVYKAPPPVVPVFSWTGWYIGGNIGYGWGENTSPDILFDNTGFPQLLGPAAEFAPSLKPKGVIGGGQIGYDWQVNPNFVLGLVADFQGADIKDSQAITRSFDTNPVRTITVSASEKLEFLGTGRVRAGWAAGNWLFYGSGGVAYGEVNSSLSHADTFGVLSESFSGSHRETRVGWAAGGGVNYAMTPNWILGADYLHYDLGHTSVTAANNIGVGNFFTASQKVGGDIVRGVISYKF